MRQKGTIKKEVLFSGIGVHSGKHVELWLKPSSSGEIIFRRIDLDNSEFHLDPKKIEAKNCSMLVAKKGRIQTLEHFMAVLFMLGVDSLIIELNEEEIPIVDGSAFPFVEAILKAGIKPLQEKKKSIKILKPFIIQEEDALISVVPDSDFRITYLIEYDHPAIESQELSLSINKENFIKQIAPARTFGFLKDVPALRAQGLALGGSLENAIVLDEKSIINGPLRFPDEFVRHKILDFIGDLFLLNSSIIGHFKAHKAGHSLHLKAVHFILDNPEYWTYE
ncbi:MAG: UDP-3-O-[3-hydroxymyristoyl] N-acetylglucosamine deacetylase [Candidatus Aminicenantes bacterium]|nr:MAG: UDP-3-O-[3-hydroxymyristoyl] N-acetylglucosamine deacetylase [Candidatus Aminicenantes bacterium]